jgi:broad specificity phosphatase PhoE
MKKILFIFAFLFTNVSFAQTTIYLVRHAEKIISKNEDPGLTAIGMYRARNLAKQLKNADITHIFSTGYKRTQQTAQPLAKSLDIEVKSYDPSKLEAFAKELKQINGNILVVGHSNTTPKLTQLLSGKNIAEIKEYEYDNLYQVILSKDKAFVKRSYIAPSTNL